MCYIIDSAHAAGLRARRTDEVDGDGDRLYVFYRNGEKVGEAGGRPASYAFISEWEHKHPEGVTA